MFFPHINHPPVRYFFGRVISMFGFPDFLPTHFRKETRNGKKKDIPKKMEEKRIRRGEQKSSTLADPAAVTADFHRSQPFSPPKVDRISQQNVFFFIN